MSIANKSIMNDPNTETAGEQSKELADNMLEFQKRMSEPNKHGWFPIHEAAYKGYANGVRRFVEHSKDKTQQLEIETKDDLQATPILIAALGSHLDVVETLLNLGAKIDVKNAQEHGIIEIASLRQDLKIIEFVINLPISGINVWKQLLQIFTNESEEISGSVGRTIEKLMEIPTIKSEKEMNLWKRNIKNFIDNNLLNILCKVFQQRHKETLISAFFITLSLIEYIEQENLFELIKQFTKAGILQILLGFLKVEQNIDLDLICLCGKVFDRFSRTNEILKNTFSLANDVTQLIYQGVFKVIQKVHNPIVLFSHLDFLTNLIKFGKPLNIQLSNLPTLVTTLIPLYRECSHDPHFFRSILRLTLALSLDSNELQTQFVKEGLSPYLGNALKHGSNDLKELSIQCIEVLSKTNIYVQKILAKDGILHTLLLLLQKSSTSQQKVLTANALWALAGDDSTQRKQMATRIRVTTLVDFLQMKSQDLFFISCDALRVLFCKPQNINVSTHQQFLDLHCTNSLVRILTHESEHIVLACIRCLQRLSIRAGLSAYKTAQDEIQKYGGVTFLVALMIHAKQDIICAEAALALAYIALENQKNLEIISDTLDFSYEHIFKLIRNKPKQIQIIALNALSILAFNNIQQQRKMVRYGTLQYSLMDSLISSKDDCEKAEAAFHLIVLANLIVDKQQALSSARGIQVLIDLLGSTVSSVKAKTEAAEKVALLARLKNGASDAIITANCINLLCDNFYTDNEDLQGIAAIAVSILSNINEGRRKLLYKCRHETSLIEVLRFYNDYKESKHSLPSQFNEEWRHCKDVGLPTPRKLINQQSKRAVIAADITLSTVKSVNFNDSSDAKIIGDSDTMIFNNTTSEGVIDEAPGDDQNLETKSNEQIEELERIEE